MPTIKPKTVVMLTADAFGVLPPIAKLTPAQAMYHFLSGYTARVAGTEKGLGKEPQATFSTCFGAPFLPRHPEVYGRMLAERIAKLIGDGSSANLKEVIERYLVGMGIKERDLPSPGGARLAPLLAGDATRGAKIYETACMVCHKFADKGNDVGPHLGTIKAWTVEQLVTNILDPNREVSPNFALYLVETNDGRTLSGLITSETAGNLTLKRADGGMDTVLRSEIKSLTSPGISLMPEGLEAAITPQQMADLIAYLTAP